MAIVLDGTDSIGDLGDALNAKLNLAGGKVLQVVRATDSTIRTTTSTTMVDANISVTITPQRSTSAVLLWWVVYASVQRATVGILDGRLQITDSANNAISGATNAILNLNDDTQILVPCSIVGYATPATTSAVTFKGRYLLSFGTTALLRNEVNTGQLFAIEVSA